MINLKSFDKALSGYVATVRYFTPSVSRTRRLAAILLAVSPPIICALFVTGPDRWALFERSGSLTAAIGLLLASRQYLKPGTFELAIANRRHQSTSDMIESLEEVRVHKLGLAVSAFGSIVMGWGRYLGLWVFAYLVIWAAIAALDAWRDFVRIRDFPVGDLSQESPGFPGAL